MGDVQKISYIFALYKSPKICYPFFYAGAKA